MRSSSLCLTIALLALIAFTVGCERKIVNQTGEGLAFTSCFTCHNDQDGELQQAQGEWANSVHASGANVDYTNRSSCPECHSHQGFVEFLEADSVSSPYEHASAIHCFTCHAPHTAGDLELRTSAAYAMEDGSVFDHGGANLCANCHHSRRSATIDIADNTEVSSHWGPHHSPQGDLVNGTNGYEYDGYTYETSTHATAIEGACVGCHMAQVRTHNGYDVGGHSFNMEDEEGNDVSGFCEDCHADADGFDFTANADYDHDGEIEGYQTEAEGLVDSLRTLLFTAGIIDDEDHPISQTIADENVTGALFNFLVVHEDRSHGIHNFKYTVDLLQSAIEYMD